MAKTPDTLPGRQREDYRHVFFDARRAYTSHRRHRTTNPIGRFIRELNWKFKGVGIFPSEASWGPATCLVWRNLETNGHTPTTRQPPKTLLARNF